MYMNPPKNTTLILVAIAAAFLVPIAIENQGEAKNHINICFENEEYEVMALQTDSINGQPTITVIDDKGWICAKTKYQKKNGPWTENFVILDRSNCNPNSPLYNYTWEDFEKLREKAKQLKEAEKTLDRASSPKTDAAILEAGIKADPLYRPEMLSK